MVDFSFLEKNRVSKKKKGIIIFFSSAISMLLLWIIFAISFIYTSLNNLFFSFLVLISALLIICMIYGVKVSLKGDKIGKSNNN